jgi:hypothetical protein
LAFDAAGNLYVAERGEYGDGLHDIHRFSATGVDEGRFGASALNDPMELAFASDGDLLVSDFNFGGIGAVRRFGSNGTDLGNFISNIDAPSGLAFMPPAVPEPSSICVLLLGSLVFLRRRRLLLR